MLGMESDNDPFPLFPVIPCVLAGGLVLECEIGALPFPEAGWGGGVWEGPKCKLKRLNWGGGGWDGCMCKLERLDWGGGGWDGCTCKLALLDRLPGPTLLDDLLKSMLEVTWLHSLPFWLASARFVRSIEAWLNTEEQSVEGQAMGQSGLDDQNGLFATH